MANNKGYLYLIQDRNFIGDFIANPAFALAKYKLHLSDEEIARHDELSDKLYETVKNQMVENLGKHAACGDDCRKCCGG